MPAPTLYLHADIDGTPHTTQCQFLDATFAVTKDGNACVVDACHVVDLLLGDLEAVTDSPTRHAQFALVAQGDGFVRVCAIGRCRAGRWSDITSPLHPRPCTWQELRDEIVTCLTAVIVTPWDDHDADEPGLSDAPDAPSARPARADVTTARSAHSGKAPSTQDVTE